MKTEKPKAGGAAGGFVRGPPGTIVRRKLKRDLVDKGTKGVDSAVHKENRPAD